MADKQLHLAPSDIRPLVPDHFGGGIASDRIMVDGLPVGYMVRDRPINPDDSGWQFFSGDETEEQQMDPEFYGVYAINTVCNVDPSIIAIVSSAPPLSAFARSPEGKLVEVPYEEIPE